MGHPRARPAAPEESPPVLLLLADLRRGARRDRRRPGQLDLEMTVVGLGGNNFGGRIDEAALER